VLHTSQSDLDTSVTATGVAQAMQRVGVRLLPKAGSLAAASLRKVLAAREETPGISLDALRDRRVATPETEWRTFMSERADGIELRAYRRGRWVESLTAASAALQRLCTDDQFARERVGFRAASLWLRGVEWTVYADGRVQAWIPETSTDSSERLELERDAARLIAAW
jgi:hypothetical protein